MERSVQRFLGSFEWKTHLQTIIDYWLPLNTVDQRLSTQTIPEILALNVCISSLCNFEVVYFEWLV